MPIITTIPAIGSRPDSAEERRREPRRIAIACQGGGSHAAFTAGVLRTLLRAQADQTGAERSFRITGLSGTSAGGMCALLAWYGLLKGREADAIERLDYFWRASAPSSPFEHWWNRGSVEAASLPFEWKASPYAPPISWVEPMLELWSRRSDGAGVVDPMNWAGWLLDLWRPRPEFVSLGELLSSQVNFEEVAKVGRFNETVEHLQSWLLQRQAMDLGLPWGVKSGQVRLEGIAERIRSVVDLDLVGLAGHREVLQGLAQDLDAAARGPSPTEVQRIRDGLIEIVREIPLLLLGAVDIKSGRFQAFSSKKAETNGGISLDAALASAAIPRIFRAVQDRYWDGLFSQNPPIRNFVDEVSCREEKADEIWVVQINPQEISRTPTTGDEIFDRRNELSGNLSLNQEIKAIDNVNRTLREGPGVRAKYKPVAIHWIRLDMSRLEPPWTMGPASKMDRDPAFLQALIAHGAEQARLFLPVRGFIEEVWKEVDPGRRAVALARWYGGPASSPLLHEMETFHRQFHDHLHVFVEGMDLVHPKDGSAGARIAWRLYGLARTGADGHHLHVTLTGNAWLEVRDDKVVDGSFGTEGIGLESSSLTQCEEPVFDAAVHSSVEPWNEEEAVWLEARHSS